MASSWRVIAWLVAVLWSLGSVPRISAAQYDDARVYAQDEVGVLPTRRAERMQLSAGADASQAPEDDRGFDDVVSPAHAGIVGPEPCLETTARAVPVDGSRVSLGSGSPRGPPATVRALHHP